MSYKNLNSSIPSDFFEYLEAAGYSYRETTRFHGIFTRGNVDILVSHLSIEVRHGAGADRLKHYVGEIDGPVFSFAGVDKLDFLGWVMLLDMTRAVLLSELFKAVGRDIVSELLYSAYKSFPEDVFLAAPTGELNLRSNE